MAAMLLGLGKRLLRKLIEKPIQQRIEFSVRTGGSEFAGDFEHEISFR